MDVRRELRRLGDERRQLLNRLAELDGEIVDLAIPAQIRGEVSFRWVAVATGVSTATLQKRKREALRGRETA